MCSSDLACVPSGLWIFRLVHQFDFCKYSPSSDARHSANQVMINGQIIKFCHHPVIGSAYPFSYWGNSEFDIFCHSVGPRLHDHARIPLAHPLQSYDRLGIGPHLILPTIAAGSQDVTLCRGFTTISTPLVTSGNH